jgi:hypothetical protein
MSVSGQMFKVRLSAISQCLVVARSTNAGCWRGLMALLAIRVIAAAMANAGWL